MRSIGYSLLAACLLLAACGKDTEGFDTALVGYWRRGGSVFSCAPEGGAMYAPDGRVEVMGVVEQLAADRFAVVGGGKRREFAYRFKGDTLVLDGNYFVQR